MRLWSIHPSHLDAKGLVALWREGLLARSVLQGKTRGYRHHPQLERFRRRADPVRAIDSYLHAVRVEARSRGYRFDGRKLGRLRSHRRVPVTRGQLVFEWRHLLRKLRRRDRERYAHWRTRRPRCHPSFCVVPGPVEPWERGGQGRRP